MIAELLGQLGARPDNMMADGYVDFAEPASQRAM
jgi:hypothetical protein